MWLAVAEQPVYINRVFTWADRMPEYCYWLYTVFADGFIYEVYEHTTGLVAHKEKLCS